MKVVHKQELQEPKQVSYLYSSKSTKRYDKIPCPVCKNVRCYEHCNNCGMSIDFKKDEYGKWHPYEQRSGALHKGCMKNGTQSGKYLDVNNTRANNAHWWRDYVVHDKDNKIMAQAKIHRYQKLTGYGYADSLKNFKEPKEWSDWIFDTK